MALSNSSNFVLTAKNLILASLEEIQVVRPGSPSASPGMLDAARRELNMLLKMYQSMGLRLWQHSEKEISMTASQRTYVLAPSGGDVTMDRPVYVQSAQRRSSSNVDTPMFKLSESEYDNLTDKFTEGSPSQFMYLPDIDQGTLYLWPVPDTSSATNDSIILQYRDAIDDIDTITEDIEVEQQWFLALKWGLADQLSNKFSDKLAESQINRITRNASIWLERATVSDRETDVSVFLEPQNRYDR